MKPSITTNTEETIKSNKSSKKSAKSRAKSSKSEAATTLAAVKNTTNFAHSSGSSTSGSTAAVDAGNFVNTPSTPALPSSATNSVNIFDGIHSSGANVDAGGGSKGHLKSYAGLEPLSIKIIWEQHDQSDVDLSLDVCARLAEDASYKLWEVINSIKTYARHSGGVVTYDLVNEVLRDADVPPSLGAMDSDWDRIDYDNNFFYYSDKIFELRDEYQKDISISIPDGPDFVGSWVTESKNTPKLKKYIPSLIYVALYGDAKSVDTILSEVAVSPIIGSCYRVLLAKIIQILAFKQDDAISTRCWRFLSACASNAHTRDVDCRQEYFHLSEILVCQLLAPIEAIKVTDIKNEKSHRTDIKTEMDDNKNPDLTAFEVKAEFSGEQGKSENPPSGNGQEEQIYKLEIDDDDDQMEGDTSEMEQRNVSPYFASPVGAKCVEDLCACIGKIGAQNGYFQHECLFHISRRLNRFFESRSVSLNRDFNYLSRAVRGLVALGEYAFREFIPFIYKFSVEEFPENLLNDFAVAALFLNGPDDIFLYEWLEFLCGCDKLQPFMVYTAQYHEKLLVYRFLRRKPATFKIYPKVGVRLLEWTTPAVNFGCHKGDPNRSRRRKLTMKDYFPGLVKPKLHLNCPGTIRFKFAGCRPMGQKPKLPSACEDNQFLDESDMINPNNAVRSYEVMIAKRRLYKPLTNERRVMPPCSFYLTSI